MTMSTPVIQELDLIAQMRDHGLKPVTSKVVFGCSEIFDNTEDHPLAKVVEYVNFCGFVITRIDVETADMVPVLYTYTVHYGSAHNPNNIGFDVVSFIKRIL